MRWSPCGASADLVPDAQGRVNLAPYSFFNAFNYDPPIIGFSSIAWKDSIQNARETREFTWNLVTRELGDQMNQTSAPLPHGDSEFQFAGLTAVAGRKVNVPRVGESRAAMECKVIDIVQFQGNRHGTNTVRKRRHNRTRASIEHVLQKTKPNIGRTFSIRSIC